MAKKSSKTRAQHEKDVRKKILSVSHKLFREQGYSKTTIRQITKVCDVKIGTIYHFFKNKADIFAALASNVFDWASERADEDIVQEDNCLRFAREMHFHVKTIIGDQAGRELYTVAYETSDIAKHLVRKRVIRYQRLFESYNPHFKEIDYITNSYMIKGALHSLAVDIETRTDIDIYSISNAIISKALQLYNVPNSKIVETLSSLHQEN